MKKMSIILVTIYGFLLAMGFAQEEKYTTKYDNIDIDAVINSERLLNGYVNCLLDRGPCAPDAAELKKNLPDALEHDCSACSETQKLAADKVSQHLIDYKPEEWSLLEEKYDPTGTYKQHYLGNKSKEKNAS